MSGGSDGYSRYERFFAAPPYLTVEWHDPETYAVGVLVINSLSGGAAGAAGGGTRMLPFPHPERPDDPLACDLEAVREEALFLAKTMEIKFRVSGPDIGGAKSVLHFDPADPRKREVLSRWFRAIGPYLRSCYGTGGDLNVDEILDVVPLIGPAAGVSHPQEGVVAGQTGATGAERQRLLGNLRRGVSAPVALPGLPELELKLADLVTGYGVAVAAAAYVRGIGEELGGKRVLVEGFGAVGGPAAYYLHEMGARVVGVSCKEGDDFVWAADPDGLDVPALFARRRGPLLPADCERGPSPEPLRDLAAEVFIPAARSKSIGFRTLDRLSEAGVETIVCGANNPFDDEAFGDLAVQRRADRELSVVPDFIANAGMARAFAYLMSERASVDPDAMLDDVRRTIEGAVDRLLADGPLRTGVLERAFATFVPSASARGRDRGCR
jgi:glutamate dehydrogenase/leucine dehydrogenase